MTDVGKAAAANPDIKALGLTGRVTWPFLISFLGTLIQRFAEKAVRFVSRPPALGRVGKFDQLGEQALGG
jgi:hypothetical protein